MAGVKNILFIDANQYLDLYQMVEGKKLLPRIEELQDYIFVTNQIVREVRRNKLQVAASFLSRQFKILNMGTVAVPDHLSSETDTKADQFRSRIQRVQEIIEEIQANWKKVEENLLSQISRSEDLVSRALDGIFKKAVAPSEDELRNARQRKELGNPPGKRGDPLGDQLSWEQFLSCCDGKDKVWIITKDGDFATKHQGKLYLNADLYQDIFRLHKSPTESFCFDNIPDAIAHFVSTTHFKAEKALSPQETNEIKKEQESLPSLDWLESDSVHAAWSTLRNAIMNYDPQVAALKAALLNAQLGAEWAIPPILFKKPDK